MVEELDFLINLQNELKQTNSAIDKKNILKKYYEINNELFSKFMNYIYSFDKKYWLTQKNIEKFTSTHEYLQKYNFSNEQNIFDILDQICNRIVTGHNAIYYFINLVNFIGEKYREILYSIVEKDLKVNINVSLINKINPDIINEFKVSLAERFDEAPTSRQVNFSDGSWMVSRKLDGVRTLAIDNNGEIELYSRSGALYYTLDIIKPQIKQILDFAKQKYNKEFILDGETCILDEHGNEKFSSIIKEVTKKNHTIENPTYIVFDLIEKEEFIKTIGTKIFGDRIKTLIELNVSSFGKYVNIVEHELNINDEIFLQWKEKSNNLKWEGLILRNQDSVYNGKRSYDLQKVKDFKDAEYIVEDIEIGKKKMLINKEMKEIECVKSLLIRHKNFIVRVGSGLSDEERLLWLDKKLIVGNTITVQYFDESIDSKTNELSLRFPTLKAVYGKKRFDLEK